LFEIFFRLPLPVFIFSISVLLVERPWSLLRGPDQSAYPGHPPPAGADGPPQPCQEVHGQAHPHGPRPSQAHQSGMVLTYLYLLGTLHLLELMAPHNLVRKFMARLIHMVLVPAKLINQVWHRTGRVYCKFYGAGAVSFWWTLPLVVQKYLQHLLTFGFFKKILLTVSLGTGKSRSRMKIMRFRKHI
jgi:hypothetical protein